MIAPGTRRRCRRQDPALLGRLSSSEPQDSTGAASSALGIRPRHGIDRLMSFRSALEGDQAAAKRPGLDRWAMRARSARQPEEPRAAAPARKAG
jgi:hypothetical protein